MTGYTCEICLGPITEDEYDDGNYRYIPVTLGDGTLDDEFHVHTTCKDEARRAQRQAEADRARTRPHAQEAP